MSENKLHMFGIAIDRATLETAASDTLGVAWSRRAHCPYVVTPNVDHVVKLQEDAAFMQAYREAHAVYADGKPVVMVSALFGQRLPGVVPGSDLVPAMFDEAVRLKRPLTVYLLGAAEGVGLAAAKQIEAEWGSYVKVTGVYSPPMGFERDPDACRAIIADINECSPDVLVLGLGAPKQELWINQHFREIRAGVALCVGATIDFLAGNKKRAPAWVRRLALEWVYRVLQEPKRLAGRYAHDIAVFPGIFFRELKKRGVSGKQTANFR